jgi:hypothetical protein
MLLSESFDAEPSLTTDNRQNHDDKQSFKPWAGDCCWRAGLCLGADTLQPWKDSGPVSVISNRPLRELLLS